MNIREAAKTAIEVQDACNLGCNLARGSQTKSGYRVREQWSPARRVQLALIVIR
jgi:hypothetical protein